MKQQKNSAMSGFEDISLPMSTLWAGDERLVNQETIPVENPCTGLQFAEIPVATMEDVRAIVGAGQRALVDPAWRNLSPLKRERLLHRLADAMESDLPYLAALESLDTGKPITQTESIDVPAAVNWLRSFAGWPSKLAGRSGTLSSSSGEFHAYTRREPVGVVAAIVPWNFPLVLAMWKIAPALAAGCTVVLKPAAETSFSALRLLELAREVGFPPGVLSVITGGSEVGAALTAHPGIARVAFTGSTMTGRSVLQAAIQDFKRVSLELGGKSASIICPDADLTKAIPDAAMACFFGAGQVCYSGSRLYVHRSVYEQVLDGIAAIGGSLRMGDSADRRSQLGPLISSQQHARVSHLVDRALSAGIARQSRPENSLPERGYFYPPTVLRDVPPDAEIAREEVFGPVLTAAPYDDIDEVIALANNSTYGLSAYLWTRDVKVAHRVAARLEVGTVFINCILRVDPAYPFGGIKQSGIGRENGQEAIDSYLETKTVVVEL